MKFTIKREYLLKPLQQVNKSICNNPIMPILNNLLLQVSDHGLFLTGTNLEIEILAHVILTKPYKTGKITIPARKLLDICRNLPDGSVIIAELIKEKNRILIKSGRSKFFLSTLPAANFPSLDNLKNQIEFTLPQSSIKRLIESTYFAMAHQDTNYFINGMLIEIKNNEIRTVSTDGHRLAICRLSANIKIHDYSIIIPRKSVIELMRSLEERDDLVRIQIDNYTIRAYINNLIFTSKLLEGKFPNYNHIFPKNTNLFLESNFDALKQACIRTSILSNEKFCVICLHICKNQLKIFAKNQLQEEAEETLDVMYSGPDIKINFNVNYILDALNAFKQCENVRIILNNPNSSIQIEDTTSRDVSYLIMPIRL